MMNVLLFSNLHTQAINAGIPITEQLLQFDFSYEPAKGSAYITSVSSIAPHLDLVEHAKANGSLSIKNGVARGRVVLPITANFNESRLRFITLEDSGINGKPIHGLAIDNIMISSRN